MQPPIAANVSTTFTIVQPRLAVTSVSDANTNQLFIPRSPHGNPQVFTPWQTQPSIPPMYVMPTQDNTWQIAETLAKVTQLQRLPQAKPDVYKGDEKDKTKFFLWETAFDALVDSAPASAQQKLHLLYQHLEGKAKRVVEQLQYMIEDPGKAYQDARKKLKDRFGHSVILSTYFETKLMNCPKIDELSTS